jgi:hypothetical protein
MSRILDIPTGDYRIAVQPGGDILLYTGNSSGRVIISGNLVVEGDNIILGDTTNANVADLEIEDRIARLNVGETGAGITGGVGVPPQSGIEIVRGSLPNARLVFDENAPYEDPITATQGLGAFSFKIVDSNGAETIAGIQTNSIDTGGGPLMFDAGSNPLRAAAANYETYVITDDDIPNSKWVTDYVTSFTGSNPPTSIKQLDTLVAAEDFDITGVDSIVRIQTDGFNRVIVGNSSATVYDLTISGTTISTSNSGDDLNLVALGGGSIKIADILHLDSDTNGVAPAAPVTGTIVYHDSTTTKDTGIQFTNANKSGELASRRTAVLYALIF